MGEHRKPLVAYSVLFFTLFINIYAREYVPVLLWESSDVSKKETHFPALVKWKTEDFTDFIAKEVNSRTEKPLVIVFNEDNLSVEDFSWQDEVEHGSYPKLQSLTSKSYRVNFVPSVHSPMKAFKDLVQSGYSYKNVDLAQDSIDELPYSSGTVLAIKLDGPKPEEDRPDYLRRHDQVIVDTFNQLLAKNTNILAAYTGHYSSYFDTDSESTHRVRRLMATPSAEAPPSGLWRDTDNKIFLHWSGFVPELSDSSKPNSTIELKEPYAVQTDERDLLQRLIAKFKTNNGSSITLRFRFPSTADGYWSFSEVEYGGPNSNQELILKTYSQIQAPYNFSYHCGENITFVNGSTKLVLSNLQVQPFLQAAIFSDAYDCVWFFTPAIWSGIFVTTILAFIMIWGISMMLDIKTMDRFDDPKGKSITIGAFE